MSLLEVGLFLDPRNQSSCLAAPYTIMTTESAKRSGFLTKYRTFLEICDRSGYFADLSDAAAFCRGRFQ